MIERYFTKYSIASAFLLMLIFALCNLKSGAINYSWHDLISTLWHPLYHPLATINILQVRLPMVLMAIIAGSGLAVAGLLLQRLTRNPLACPSLLGIEYGTALSVILSYMFIPHIHRVAVIGLAFLGGFLTYFFMQMIIARTKATLIGITLIGVAFNTLYYSLIQAILIAFPYQAQAILYDLNGSLQGINLNDIQLIIAPFSVLLSIAFLFSRHLALLDLDEAQAISLGVPIKFYRLVLLALSILLSTIITSLTGPLLFFGLIIPHLVKPFSATHSNSMLYCALFGALFLLIAAWLTRIISPLTPPPVGLVVLLMSAPILLLVTKRYFAHDEI